MAGQRREKRYVLHILSGMNRGGIETWLMNVLRRVDPDAVQFDFLVEAQKPCTYDEEILARGGRIFRSPRYRHRSRAALQLAQVLRENGPYDVVHAHGRHNMALFLAVAQGMSVPVRIGHVHNVTDSHNQTVLQRAYKRATKELLFRSATWILGCSTAAVESLYGEGATQRYPHCRMLPYGIDMSRFAKEASRQALMAELGIPEGALIFGHVGRFVWEKNHAFLVDVFAELSRRHERAVLVLVGDGPLRAEITAAFESRGLAGKVRFTGMRDDIPALMSAMDVFLFTSIIEGFGLVLVEAQAVGLPCVIGEHLPADVEVVPGLIIRRALDAGIGAWADAAEQAATVPRDPAAAHAAVAGSHFNIDRSVELLLGQYYGFAGGALGHAE